MRHGNHRRSVWSDRAVSAGTARQRLAQQPPSRERDPVRRGERLQMARAAEALRQLAHDLHAHESLGQGRRAGSLVRGVAASAARSHQDRGGQPRQYDRQGASRRYRRSKKNGPQAIGRSRGGWTTKIHMVAADARSAIAFSLTPGQAGDAPAGRDLLLALPDLPARCRLIMDRAYEGNETRQLALDLGFIPVVPPHPLRAEPWKVKKAWYRRRKGFRRIFSRFDKLDVMFMAFLCFALVVEALR